MSAFLHWLAVHTGTVNEGGPYYGFFSGFGSDIGEVALIGGLVQLVRHQNCEVKGCWRFHHRATAAGHKVCKVHHPDHQKNLTHADVIKAHNNA